MNTKQTQTQLTEEQIAVIGLLFVAGLTFVSTIICAITNSLN